MPVDEKLEVASQLRPFDGASRTNRQMRVDGDRSINDVDDDDDSSISSLSSAGTLRPRPSMLPSYQNKSGEPRTVGTTQEDTNNSAWGNWFDEELYLDSIQDNKKRATFHVYLKRPATVQGPLLVAHHGAGSSALSFSLFLKELQLLLPEFGILAVDAREHGSTVWNSAGITDPDLSLEKLGQDLATMVRLTTEYLHWPVIPPIFLLGHSLGGAVVVHAAFRSLIDAKILGYIVLDVVEGSALEALKLMQQYLAMRPSTFGSIDEAVQWHLRSRTLRNLASAEVSVPPLLAPTPEGNLRWKTDLSKTEAYWEDWFSGMSKKFLTAKGAKLLILAGTDRLDKELMIGQMQGEYE